MENNQFRGTCALGRFAVLAWVLCKCSASADEPDLSLVRQFTESHCTQCHRGSEPEAGIQLEGAIDLRRITRDRQTWMKVVAVLTKRQMPPKEEPQPSHDELDKVLNVLTGTFDRIDKTAKPDPGRITVRRLNRTEYNNTIRDLVGVDFRPADDFPSDDIGHGFDNIGDVLSVSPILMERYLTAAESIVQRAIVPNPPPPPKRHLAARWTEPAGPGVPESRFRPITTKSSDKPIETGPLFTGYQVPDGEFVFRTRVFVTSDDGKPAQVAILACSDALGDTAASDAEAARISGLAVNGLRPFRIVSTIEVTANDEKSAQRIEVPVPRTPGLKRIAVGLLKPETEPISQTLHVEFFELEGPMDPRPESHRRLLVCTPDKPKSEQTREILERFASRAYRRPVTDTELTRLMDLVAAAEMRGEKWEAALQFAMQAVLVSPKFLFRLELDQNPDSTAIRPLDEFQLASRLSYFLWSTMPDDELFELARNGQLAANLGSQVTRMLKDSKSTALVDDFALQWLQLKRLQSHAPDSNLFRGFRESLRRSMLQETRLFIEAIVREDRSILDLIDGRFTYLNESLARHYGIVDTSGTRAGQKPQHADAKPIRGREFVRVELPDSDRGGLLTQASVLTVTSNPTRTSPVKRGKWVLEQLLGTPPPPPPGNVPELEDQKDQLTGSLRQQMEQHRKNPACANCHADMDPLGFAFENYDAIGAFRTKDGEFEIDPSGTLPDGGTFRGPAELKAILREKKELFTRCLTEKMLTYALGRGIEYYDRPVVDRIVRRVAEQDFKFSALVIEIANSEPFRQRRSLE